MKTTRTHNQSEQLAFRKKLRHNTTPEENFMWKLLKGRSLGGYRWRRQFSVGPYILDFYCPEAKLCVELDGVQHSCDEVALHDERRREYLLNEGIRVLRIPNKIVWSQSDVIAKAILELLATEETTAPPALRATSPNLGEEESKLSLVL